MSKIVLEVDGNRLTLEEGSYTREGNLITVAALGQAFEVEQALKGEDSEGDSEPREAPKQRTKSNGWIKPKGMKAFRPVTYEPHDLGKHAIGYIQKGKNFASKMIRAHKLAFHRGHAAAHVNMARNLEGNGFTEGPFSAAHHAKVALMHNRRHHHYSRESGIPDHNVVADMQRISANKPKPETAFESAPAPSFGKRKPVMITPKGMHEHTEEQIRNGNVPNNLRHRAHRAMRNALSFWHGPVRHARIALHHAAANYHANKAIRAVHPIAQKIHAHAALVHHDLHHGLTGEGVLPNKTHRYMNMLV